MKKIAAICLCVIMAVSMVACGSSSSSGDTKNTSSKSSASSSSADSKSGDSKGGDSSGQDLSKYKFNKGELVRMTDDKNEPLVADLDIKGLIVVGNRTEGTELDSQKDGGYKTSGLKSSFELNEHITLYADMTTAGSIEDLKIACIPHKDISEYVTKSGAELIEEAQNSGAVETASGPDAENDNMIVDFYVGPVEEKQAGDYDILFIYKNKLAYYLPIDLTKPAE